LTKSWVKCKICGKAQLSSENKILCEHTYDHQTKRISVDNIKIIEGVEDPSENKNAGENSTKTEED
jgi:hypothetical protein